MENLTHTTETSPETAAPKPGSQAQIDASPANRAAKNSRRHGLLGRLTVMETERSEAFIDLCTDLYEKFQPLDEHERNLVDTMVIAIWRRTRALGMESAGLSHIIRKQYALTIQSLPAGVPIYENDTHSLAFKALVNNSTEQRVLDLLHRYEVRHTRAYDRALKSLLAYRKSCQTDPSHFPVPSLFDNAHRTTADSADAGTSDSRPESAPTIDPERQSVPNEPKPVPAIKFLPNKPKPAPKTESRQARRLRERQLKKLNKRRSQPAAHDTMPSCGQHLSNQPAAPTI